MHTTVICVKYIILEKQTKQNHKIRFKTNEKYYYSNDLKVSFK